MQKRWALVIVGLMVLFGVTTVVFCFGKISSNRDAKTETRSDEGLDRGKASKTASIADIHKPKDTHDSIRPDKHGHEEHGEEGHSDHKDREVSEPGSRHDDETKDVHSSGKKAKTEVDHSESDHESHGNSGHGHDGEDSDHETEKVIRISHKAANESGIRVEMAQPGKMHVSLTCPGEVVVNSDKTAHIVPRLTGVVREVRKNLGDAVTAGEIMAIIDSRELAESKAKYLAALTRLELARTNFNRYEALWKKEAIPEKQFLELRSALDEALIELRSAEQKLYAMGFSQEYLKEFPQWPNESLSRYEIIAPFDATVISKHITLGEMLKEDADAFEIADLSSVWVNLSIYQKDLPYVKQGQAVTVSVGNGTPDAEGSIVYLEPLVRDRVRAAVARVVLPNPERKWRPGIFVKAKVIVDELDVPILIPTTGFQTIEGTPHVFVQTDAGFEARPAKIGRTNGSYVEIISGLKPGEQYAKDGTFVLKAALGKGDPHAGHSH